MRIWIWITIIVLLAGGAYAGFRYAKQAIASAVMDQVVEQVMQDAEVQKLLNDPDVLQAIQDAAAAEDIEQISRELRTGASGSTSSSESQQETPLAVTNIDEAQSLVLEKFSIGEIREYAGMAAGGLTATEMDVLKEVVLDKFNEEEMHALKVVALLEAQRRVKE